MSCSIAYCCNFSFNIPSPTISRCNNSLCLTCVRASSKMPTFLLESNRPMTIRLNFPLLINLLLLRTILPVMQFSGIHILSLWWTFLKLRWFSDVAVSNMSVAFNAFFKRRLVWNWNVFTMLRNVNFIRPINGIRSINCWGALLVPPTGPHT